MKLFSIKIKLCPLHNKNMRIELLSVLVTMFKNDHNLLNDDSFNKNSMFSPFLDISFTILILRTKHMK